MPRKKRPVKAGKRHFIVVGKVSHYDTDAHVYFVRSKSEAIKSFTKDALESLDPESFDADDISIDYVAESSRPIRFLRT